MPVALQETTPGGWREPGSQLEGLDLHTSHPHLHLGNLGFPGGSDGKESACSAGDTGLIPGLGRSPGEGNGNPLQYSCLGNPMDRRAWRVTVHGAAKESDVTKCLNNGNNWRIRGGFSEEETPELGLEAECMLS